MESYELGKVLTDRALAAENLLSSGAKLPVILNDRGPSMKAKAFRQFLQDLGITQLFGRPRTPNDNFLVEAFFRTAKYHPQFSDRFEDLAKAEQYFKKTFFPWYNEVHLHSGIGFVPPALKHAGQAERILRVRRERLVEARSRRLEVNRRASCNVKGVPSTAERLSFKSPAKGDKDSETYRDTAASVEYRLS
jgi:hypothetical protein